MKPLRRLLIPIMLVLTQVTAGAEENHINKRLLEKVDVTNAIITVRVFDKKKPVIGLKKNDFQVIENGKERKINQCYMTRKQLQVEEDAVKEGFNRKPAPIPRLFVLIFNISDYRLNINQGVDYFFDHILRPKDRLMIITNRFFLNDHLVMDPHSEKRRTQKLIFMEMVWAKSTINEIEKTLKSFIDEYNDSIAIRNMRNENDSQDGGGRNNTGGANNPAAGINPDDPDRYEREAISLFVIKYVNFVKEIKKSFLHIPLREYIGLAAYLKEHDLEKWVLNFFQIPRFPQPELNSDFLAKIRACGYSFDIFNAAILPEETEENSIARLFVNTGATFHTLLMKYEGELFTDSLKNYLSYQPITNDSEAILRKISRMTGGSVMRSNKIKDLYDKISNKEDIYYVLAYKIDPLTNSDNRKISVTVKNKNYKILFDNRKRSGYFRRTQEKFLSLQEKKTPQIRLKHVNYQEGILRILVEDFKIDSTVRPNSGQVQVRLQFLDERSKVVLDKEKIIKAPDPHMVMAIKLSELSKGQYDVVIMVKDLVTGMQDLAIQEVAVQ